MKHLSLIIFSLLLSALSFQLNGRSTDYAELLKQLESEISQGNKIALRDVGTLLDEKSSSAEARRILKKYSLFLKKEFDVNTSFGKKEFLSFYYDHVNEIKFFHPAEVFYLSAFDTKTVKHEIISIPKDLKTQKTVLLRKHFNEWNKYFDSKNEAKAKKQLMDIAVMNTKESKEVLLGILQKKEFQKSKFKSKRDMVLIICEALKSHATIETVNTLLDISNLGYLPIQKAQPILAHLTNHLLFEDKNMRKGIKRYRHLVDSLKTMENLRYAGYEKVFDFGKNIFPHPVDYYGRIAALSDKYPWMKKNALYDLMETEHSRALLYLVSDLYRSHNAASLKSKNSQPIISVNEYYDLIKEYTELKIKVLNGKGTLVNPFEHLSNNAISERIYGRNFLRYWMVHYSDFAWNDSYQLYINKNELLAETENYEKLFRRLPSTNDGAALTAFMQLTEGKPEEILKLSDKYKQLFRSYNKSLPTIRHQFLEQLALLTEFCRNNNLNYKPSEKLKNRIDELKGNLTPKERFYLENKIVNNLELSEVTALEYYACLFESNLDFNFSVGRILDHFYTRNWNSILTDDTQLRLFLKKSILFRRIGTTGSCNAYLNKIDKNDSEILNRLKEILEVEPDDDIIYLIEDFQPQGEQVVDNSNLLEFIEDPKEFSKNDMRTLPAPTNKIVKTIIDRLQTEKDKKVIGKFIKYLKSHASLDAVPLYFELIDNGFVIQNKYDLEITMADMMEPIIEEAFQVSFDPPNKKKRFATDKWRTLWKEDGKNYKNWQAKFFEEKLESFFSVEVIKIKELNNILASEYFKEEHLIQCLEVLNKIKPQRDIRKLKTPEKLSVKKHLKHFSEFYLNHKDLDNMVKLFVVDDSKAMFEYLTARASKFEAIAEKSEFWNSIFLQPWFNTFISQADNLTDKDLKILQGVKVVLETYLDEEDFLSEYEDQRTNVNIDQLAMVGKNLKEQLEASIKSKKDEKTKAMVQQSIISRVSYQDIGTVMKSIDKLSASDNFNPLLFLQKDFGIPFFDVEDSKARAEFINRHAKMSEYELYKYYIKSYGIDLFSKKDNLDLQKIYEMLPFEIVTPFAGGGGSNRDQFTYGVIKLLELHFKTRLDFHKKLNENQNFYTYSSTKRAIAWRNYLVENKLVVPNQDLAPSFNDVVNK